MIGESGCLKRVLKGKHPATVQFKKSGIFVELIPLFPPFKVTGQAPRAEGHHARYF